MLKKALNLCICSMLLICISPGCSKENSEPPDPPPVSTITDLDGNVYQTITIGAQVWMASNLRVTRYRNGDTIGTAATDSIWGATNTGLYCDYENNPGHSAADGHLYNWMAVNDPRGLAPEGWRVPTDADWTQLAGFLIQNGLGYEGSGDDIAKALATDSDWSFTDIPGSIGNRQEENNASGFSALPAGFRNHEGLFGGAGSYAGFWSATLYPGSDSYALMRILTSNNTTLGRSNTLVTMGLSVRCIKN